MVVSLVYYSDVLVTLKHHEIRQHSVGHSSPMWAHYTDLGKFEDLIHKAKDITHEAKDYRNCPQGSSRPRTCPRGLHHCPWSLRIIRAGHEVLPCSFVTCHQCRSSPIFSTPLQRSLWQCMYYTTVRMTYRRGVLFFVYYFLNLSSNWPRAGSGVVRIDPLRFLAGCGTRRLNQV